MLDWLSQYSAGKSAIGDYLGASEALLHVHAGLSIFLLSSLLFRRRMRSRVPISLVFAFAVANELADVMTPGHTSRPWEPIFDILNTVVWPTLLFLLARRRLSKI